MDFFIMKTRKPMPIIFSVDDRYVPYLTVAIASLLDSKKSRTPVEFHILFASLSEASRQNIAATVGDRAVVIFDDISEKLLPVKNALGLRDYYSVATYFRFFIPDLLPQFDKALYLDCDILVREDITKLYRTPLCGKLVGAVTDTVVTANETFSDYVSAVIGCAPENYFNAGILLMNLRKMRSTGLLRRFSSLLKKRTFPVAQDQDYLNVLAADDVLYLSPAWNVTAFPDADTSDVRLLHYKMSFKPWHYRGIPLEEEFWQVAKKTPYAHTMAKELATYTDRQKENDRIAGDALLRLAEEEIRKVERAREEQMLFLFSLAGEREESAWDIRTALKS